MSPRPLSDFKDSPILRIARGIGTEWDAPLALVMRHIASSSEIDTVQLQIMTATVRSNFAPVAFLMSEIQPTTGGRDRAFRAALRRELKAEADLLIKAWDRQVAPVTKVRNRHFAHSIWAVSMLPELENSLILMPPSAVLAHDARVRDEIAEAIKTHGAEAMIPLPPFDRSLAVVFSKDELFALLFEAGMAAGTAEFILFGVDDVLRTGSMREDMKGVLRIWLESDRLPSHRKLLESSQG